MTNDLKAIDTYLSRQVMYPPLLSTQTHPNSGIAIVIPCYKEEDIITTLQSLKDCESPECAVEVVVVINDGEDDEKHIKSFNDETYIKCIQWSKDHNTKDLMFYAIRAGNLPPKWAGVGLARKIGMDEAVRRLPLEGIIAGLDADSTCRKDYLIALESHFRKNPAANGCSIFFEHPLEGHSYPKEVYDSIIQYELHLRYFVDIQKRMGLPFAYQTVGSSMAVRKSAYCEVGGMNKRKAGEDFYFLHKLIKQGRFSECNTTTVYPSPRISDRVPFGTGKAVGDMISNERVLYHTYHPGSIEIISKFVSGISDFYHGHSYPIPQQLISFLDENDFQTKMKEIKWHTSHLNSFKKRFFQWFDAFRFMKTLHYLRDHHFKNIPVKDAVIKMYGNTWGKDEKEMLIRFREKVIDKS